MNALGGAVGVLAGGLLTEVGGWQWVMWISVPMAAAAIALATRSITPDLARSGGRPDVLGAVLATSGMVLLVFGVVRTEGGAWTAPPTVGALVGALVLLALFLRVEQTTARRPLLRLGLLANRAVAGANLVNLLVGAAMAAAFYFVSLYLQHVLGHGPALTGLEFLPFALGVVAGSVLAARWGRRLPAKGLIVLGTLTTGFGAAELLAPGRCLAGPRRAGDSVAAPHRRRGNGSGAGRWLRSCPRAVGRTHARGCGDRRRPPATCAARGA
jgi:hypothetical protein